jgi:uncharacterized protein YjbJ (UPF0337 family)
MTGTGRMDGNSGTANASEKAQVNLVRALLCFPSVANRKEVCFMNWDQAKGNWKQVKGKIKEKWGQLTDDELDQIEGKRDQLIGKIQKQYGISKEEAETQVKSWENQHSL